MEQEEQYYPPYLNGPKPVQKTFVMDELDGIYKKRNELALLYLIDCKISSAKSALMGVFDNEIDEAIKDAKSIH